MVGQVNCDKDEKLCTRFGITKSDIIYWEPIEDHLSGVTNKILGTDAKEISKEVLSFLPEPSTLDEIGFEVLL